MRQDDRGSWCIVTVKAKKQNNNIVSERFHRLCLEDTILCENDGDGIGTYNEKRFHRIFKRFVSDDASCYEVKIGNYVADVLCDGHITEIQTASFSKLAPKIKYYLEETDHTVSVVIPLICHKRIIRADKKTGEIMYTRTSPQKAGLTDALDHLYYLREYLYNPRLMIHMVLISAEEYRYSERMRYRREGAYDRDLRPVDIKEEIVLRGAKDYLRFLPQDLRGGEFDTAAYSKNTGLRGRRMYSALNVLTALGILVRRREGKKYFYTFAPDFDKQNKK